MREEIFGPSLIVGYRDAADAIAYVNARARSRCNPIATSKHQCSETAPGGATVNETILHIAQEDLPSKNPSGMGEYHGRRVRDISSVAVFRQPRLNLLGLSGHRTACAERLMRLAVDVRPWRQFIRANRRRGVARSRADRSPGFSGAGNLPVSRRGGRAGALVPVVWRARCRPTKRRGARRSRTWWPRSIAR
jgi:hypothetical protein